MSDIDPQPMMMAGREPALRRIWLCADDYGMAPGVNAAIRDLVVRGRINATSAMVVAPSLTRSEAIALSILNSDTPRVAIGLHVTLTGPFRPITSRFGPLRDGAFPPLPDMLKAAMLRRLDRERLAAEIAAQLQAFVALLGRPPDFVDGHQHVHIFPQVRDAFLDVVCREAPDAWVRQCGRADMPLMRRMGDRKGLLLDTLSRSFRRRAAARGTRTNPAFAGTYDFTRSADFAALFPRFLERLPDGGLIMCHPGFVDAELDRLDPLTAQREREHAFLGSDAFHDVLSAHRAALA